MRPVGLFEAKTHLSELCEAVATKRETVVITRRGKPLVRLEPIPDQGESERSSAWARRDAFERKHGRQREDLELPRRERQRYEDPLGG
jgi:prevent-host-death family protein